MSPLVVTRDNAVTHLLVVVVVVVVVVVGFHRSVSRELHC